MTVAQRNKTKARSLPKPKPISATVFDDICQPYGIRSAERDRLLPEINKIVADITAWMKKQRHESARVQRQRLESAGNSIVRARKLLSADSDRLLLSFSDKILAPMISPLWLVQQFPEDVLAPRAAGLAPMVDDQTSIRQRRDFIKNRPVEAIGAVLTTIEAALAYSTKTQRYMPGAKGGPKQLTVRRDFILMLAYKWERLGKRAIASPELDFVAFVSNVMDAMGWPSDEGGKGDAVVAAVAGAFKFRRNLTSK